VKRHKLNLTKKDLFDATKKIIQSFCSLHGYQAEDGKTLFQELRREIEQALGTGNFLPESKEMISFICVRLWTSTKCLNNAAPRSPEFCSMLNAGLRGDFRCEEIVKIVFGINLHCNLNRHLMNHPQWKKIKETDEKGNLLLFRGGALPPVAEPFYQPNKAFRCPMLLGTTPSKKIALDSFARVRPDQTPEYPGCNQVLWIFQIDPLKKCAHVSWLDNKLNLTSCPTEKEFLFVPYSVFTVVKKEMDETVPSKPVLKIYLKVAPDNVQESEDLPVSPWN